MAKSLKGVTASVLQWARESQGYSLEEVAQRLGREPDEVRDWESEDSEASPTYAQLEKLAYKLYKRPLAVFFLPSPPEEPSLRQEFRTLPDFEIDQLAPETRYLVRVARAFQISLHELSDGENQAPSKIFRDISLSSASDVIPTAEEIRRYLEVSMAAQSSWGSTDSALKKWRLKVEEHGVFVFKNSFKQKDISGFSLAHEEFPIIFINNNTPKSRQIFSLFHELVHLLLHMNSISKVDESYLQYLPQAERNIEVFCNAVAAEVLIPSGDFEIQMGPARRFDDAAVQRLADRYSVSREAILRRMLNMGVVTSSYYQQRAREWVEELEHITGTGGGNYYATQAAYLGESYLRLVFSRHFKGEITAEQAAEYLGVRTASMAGLEEFVAAGSP